MSLIQDIVPSRQQTLRRVRQLHQATIIPTPTMEPVRRMHARRYNNTRSHSPRSKPRQRIHDITPLQRRKVAQLPRREDQVLRRPQVPVRATNQQHKIEPPVLQKKTKPKSRPKIFDFMQYPLIAIAAVGASYSPTIGQVIIGAYLVLALIFKLHSKVTFGLALLLLVSIPLFILLQQSGTAENAAIYAYDLLLAGTIQAILELWRQNRTGRRVAPSR